MRGTGMPREFLPAAGMVAALLGCATPPASVAGPDVQTDALTQDALARDTTDALMAPVRSDDVPTSVDGSDDGGPSEEAPRRVPPPIYGGTLSVARDGTAVVSDPDDDRVLLVDLGARAVVATFPLERGDEPGRVVTEGRRAHVVLRGGGAVLSIDLASRAVLARRAVCALPRGIAWDEARDVLYVACMGGEFITLPTDGGAERRRVTLDRDLRDVVVVGNRLLVTRFRSAQTLVLDAQSAVVGRETLGNASTAWRAIAGPYGGMWLLHQRVTDPTVVGGSVSYGTISRGVCGGGDLRTIVTPTVSWVQPMRAPVTLGELLDASLVVDLAVEEGGPRAAVAIAGSDVLRGGAQVRTFGATTTVCGLPPREERHVLAAGQGIAVAFAPSGVLVAQTRAPSTLVAIEEGAAPVAIPLGGSAIDHPGHQLFHVTPATPLRALACASCHPEGDEDGNVWTLDPGARRRTQTLRGGLLATAPFHWDGSLLDLATIAHEFFVRRLGLPPPTPAAVGALGRWLDALPAHPGARGSPDAEARGEAVFRDPTTRCGLCHSGPRFSDGNSADVGSGGRFQVPSLRGVAWRAPYLHNGCAGTLREVFTRCGGAAHGTTSHLTDGQIDDLITYVESL